MKSVRDSPGYSAMNAASLQRTMHTVQPGVQVIHFRNWELETSLHKLKMGESKTLVD